MATKTTPLQVGERVAFRDPNLWANIGTVQAREADGWVRVKWDGAIAQRGTIEAESNLMRWTTSR